MFKASFQICIIAVVGVTAASASSCTVLQSGSPNPFGQQCPQKQWCNALCDKPEYEGMCLAENAGKCEPMACQQSSIVVSGLPLWNPATYQPQMDGQLDLNGEYELEYSAKGTGGMLARYVKVISGKRFVWYPFKSGGGSPTWSFFMDGGNPWLIYNDGPVVSSPTEVAAKDWKIHTNSIPTLCSEAKAKSSCWSSLDLSSVSIKCGGPVTAPTDHVTVPHCDDSRVYLKSFFDIQTGNPAAAKTEVALCWNKDSLTASYNAYDSSDFRSFGNPETCNTHVWNANTMEMMIAPGSASPTKYMEIDVSPNGAYFATQLTKPFFHNWTDASSKYFPERCKSESTIKENCPCSDLDEGIQTMAASSDDLSKMWSITLEVKWPRLALGTDIQNNLVNSTWRANFYRVVTSDALEAGAVCSFENCSYIGWKPTQSATFHVADKFGTLKLAARLPTPDPRKACPDPNSHVASYVRGNSDSCTCECNSGYNKTVDAEGKMSCDGGFECPAYSWQSSGDRPTKFDDCTCNFGFVKKDGQCVKADEAAGFKCPADSFITSEFAPSSFADCQCFFGFKKTANACVKKDKKSGFKCPENSFQISDEAPDCIKDCQCFHGFEKAKDGLTCQKAAAEEGFTCPENSFISTSDPSKWPLTSFDDCACFHGYSKVDGACVKDAAPTKATSNDAPTTPPAFECGPNSHVKAGATYPLTADGCVCDFGYSKSKDSDDCSLSTTKQEYVCPKNSYVKQTAKFPLTNFSDCECFHGFADMHSCTGFHECQKMPEKPATPAPTPAAVATTTPPTPAPTEPAKKTILVCSSSGDPHYVPFNNNKKKRFTIQGSGEFKLVNSADQSFKVHACQQDVRTADKKKNKRVVTWNSALVVEEQGMKVSMSTASNSLKVDGKLIKDHDFSVQHKKWAALVDDNINGVYIGLKNPKPCKDDTDQCNAQIKILFKKSQRVIIVNRRHASKGRLGKRTMLNVVVKTPKEQYDGLCTETSKPKNTKDNREYMHKINTNTESLFGASTTECAASDVFLVEEDEACDVADVIYEAACAQLGDTIDLQGCIHDAKLNCEDPQILPLDKETPVVEDAAARDTYSCPENSWIATTKEGPLVDFDDCACNYGFEKGTENGKDACVKKSAADVYSCPANSYVGNVWPVTSFEHCECAWGMVKDTEKGACVEAPVADVQEAPVVEISLAPSTTCGELCTKKTEMEKVVKEAFKATSVVSKCTSCSCGGAKHEQKDRRRLTTAMTVTMSPIGAQSTATGSSVSGGLSNTVGMSKAATISSAPGKSSTFSNTGSAGATAASSVGVVAGVVGSVVGALALVAGLVAIKQKRAKQTQQASATAMATTEREEMSSVL